MTGRVVLGVALAALAVVAWAVGGGVAMLKALLLASVLALAAQTLEGRLGAGAGAWVAAWVVASPVFLLVLRPWPELALVAGPLLAFALAYRGEHPAPGQLEEIYGGRDEDRAAGALAGRALVAGAGMGVAVAWHPLYALLLWPLGLAARGRRGAAIGGLLAGTLVMAVALRLAGGGLGFTPLPWHGWGDAGPAVLAEPTLWLWSGAHLLAGRSLGVLPAFLPLLLGFVAFSGDRGRWATPLAVLAALVAVVACFPFGVAAEAVLPLGSALFLPLYPALWFVAASVRPAAWALVAVVLAGVFVYPLWLAPGAAAAGDDVAPSPVAERWLPLETTRPAPPGTTTVADHHGVALWLLDGLEPVGGGAVALRLEAGRQSTRLVVASPGSLGSLRLELGRTSPADFELLGAAAGIRMLRPDGTVAQEVLLGDTWVRHPTAASPVPIAFYDLTLRFGGPLPDPVAVAVYPGSVR